MVRTNAGSRLSPRSSKSTLLRDLWRDKWLYIMLLPGIIYFVLFKLKPFIWFAIL